MKLPAGRLRADAELPVAGAKRPEADAELQEALIDVSVPSPELVRVAVAEGTAEWLRDAHVFSICGAAQGFRFIRCPFTPAEQARLSFTRARTRMHTRAHTHEHTCTHTHAHTCTHTHTRTHTHAHARTHARTNLSHLSHLSHTPSVPIERLEAPSPRELCLRDYFKSVLFRDVLTRRRSHSTCFLLSRAAAIGEGSSDGMGGASARFQPGAPQRSVRRSLGQLPANRGGG